MKIEFFYKETGEPVLSVSEYYVDGEGDVMEMYHEYEETHYYWPQNIGWRVIDS